MNQLIKEYIILPLAIKTLKHDRELFKGRSMLNVYWSKIDHVISQMQQRHNDVKRQLIVKYKTQVKAYKQDDKRVYVADDLSYELTNHELKELTKEMISRYLYGDKVTENELGWYPEHAETIQDFIRDFTNEDLN